MTALTAVEFLRGLQVLGPLDRHEVPDVAAAPAHGQHALRALGGGGDEGFGVVVIDTDHRGAVIADGPPEAVKADQGVQQAYLGM